MDQALEDYIVESLSLILLNLHRLYHDLLSLNSVISQSDLRSYMIYTKIEKRYSHDSLSMINHIILHTSKPRLQWLLFLLNLIKRIILRKKRMRFLRNWKLWNYLLRSQNYDNHEKLIVNLFYLKIDSDGKMLIEISGKKISYIKIIGIYQIEQQTIIKLWRLILIENFYGQHDPKILTNNLSNMYEEYNKSKHWKTIKKALNNLEKNNDLKICTKEEYVIWYLISMIENDK